MTDRIHLGDQVYVTAEEAIRDLCAGDPRPDVTVAMVRAWARRRHMTTAELDGRIYYPLAALTAAEADTALNRATRGGRPRHKILDEGLTSVVH